MWCRCWVMLIMAPLSHASNGIAKATLAMAWCSCRVMQAMTLLNHASDDAAKATWPQRDVNVESCWQWGCRVILAMALSRRLSHGGMPLPSHATGGTHCHVMLMMVLSRWCWSWHNVAAESCEWWCCRGDLVATWYRCRVMLVMALPSHASDGDGTTKATLDVTRCCYRGDLVVA
jgi:hypothetical protein